MNIYLVTYDISGDLLKLLDVSSAENVLPTTYGSLQPPLGKHRLKVSSTCFVYFLILNSHEQNCTSTSAGEVSHLVPLLLYTHIFRGIYQGLIGLSRALTVSVSVIFTS